jgi:dTDP-4-amino-4,6-dideoxygalactose transaminase
MAITKENLITLEDSDELIEKRVKVWEDYDNALKCVSELEKFSAHFDDPNSEPLNSHLSKIETPPEEVDAAIVKINQEIENMQIANSNIRTYQDDIQKIKRNFKIIVAVVIIVILIIIGILVI